MCIRYNALRRGTTALAALSLAGLAANSYAKAQHPLSEDKFDAFVLQTTATSSAAYSGVGTAQCMITGEVFRVVRQTQDRRASAVPTDVPSGGNLPGQTRA
jgi:hypothetical protein